MSSDNRPAHAHHSTDWDVLQDLCGHKPYADRLAASYARLASSETYDGAARRYANKAQACAQCGTYIGMTTDPQTGKAAIAAANFCRLRLCPMCQRRRSLRIFGVTSKILDHIDQTRPGQQRWLLLTLTVRNCSLDALEGNLTHMANGWRALQRRPGYKRRVIGAMRTTEITVNQQTWQVHPHIHVMLAVPPEYMRRKSGLYWTTDQWATQWQTAMGLDYKPVVNVRAIQARSKRAATAEVSKYLAKGSDYLLTDSGDGLGNARTDWLVAGLDAAIHGVRMTSYSGIMLAAQRALAIEDPEDGDLTDDVHGVCAAAIRHYHWRPGVGYVQGGPGRKEE